MPSKDTSALVPVFKIPSKKAVLENPYVFGNRYPSARWLAPMEPPTTAFRIWHIEVMLLVLALLILILVFFAY